MKKSFKKLAICLAVFSVATFNLSAQEEIIEEFVTEEYVEENTETEKEDFRNGMYFSVLRVDQNSKIGEALDVTMPQQGIGVGYDWVFNITDYFTFNMNFGYSYGIRAYKNVPEGGVGYDKRTFSHSLYADMAFGTKMYFSKSHKTGLNIFAGFGYDYGELHIATAEPGKVMVANQKIFQHGFYVPAGLNFFFGNFSIGAVYRWRAFDIDMTVQSLNEPLLSPINRDETLKMFPIEIRLGFKL